MKIKQLLANRKNYGKERDMSNLYIVVHYTGNDGDTAKNNAEYFHNSVVKLSAHFFVDDNDIYQSVPVDHIAWAVGGSKYASCGKTGGGTMHGVIGNENSINIEMCDNSPKDGKISLTKKTREKTENLIVDLMQFYNIPIDRVYRHFDVTGKICPAYFIPYGNYLDNSVWQDKLISLGILARKTEDENRIWVAKLIYNTLKCLNKI